MEGLQEWWDNLETRERMFVLVAGIVVSVFLLYNLTWAPLTSARDNKLQQVQNKQELLAWMQTKSSEVKQLRLTNPNMLSTSRDRSLLAVVDSTAKQLGLSQSIKRIEPNGKENVNLWIENMPFDSLMILLGQLDKRDNIRVKEANLSNQDGPGLINAKISLGRV